MPSFNPFRRDPEKLTLRERTAGLRAGLARVVRKPATAAPASEPAETANGIEEFAQLDFSAYELDTPVHTPQQWTARFAAHAMSMHVADRTLRMSKPEMIAFIRDSGERDEELPSIMFQALDTAQSTFEGWGKLLGVARSRYIVAASAEQVEHAAQAQKGEAPIAQSEAPPAAAAEPFQIFTDQVEQAGLTGDVLAVCGIDHRDGTISYADATGRISRQPVAHWIAFTALQMHNQVQHEMARRRILQAGDLSAEEHAAWEARLRCELRSDAVHALTFRHDRAFDAAQAIRTGAEPSTQALREQSNAELVALAPVWEAAIDLYQQRMDEENQIVEAASEEGWPGQAPDGAGPEWQAWFQQKEDWRERTGVAAAEEASGQAGTALYKIEVQIGDLPAASLAGLKLKARVAQRSDDISVTWPENLGPGLARDILTFTEAQARRPAGLSLVDQIDFASASLEDLQALHALADLVGGVAYATAWTARCKACGEGDDYNAAGKLMQWLGDALTDVETTANDEARRRRPVDQGARETRLEMLALPAIQNGDPDEIEAFARDLLAHAQGERQGR